MLACSRASTAIPSTSSTVPGQNALAHGMRTHPTDLARYTISVRSHVAESCEQ
jgi:hypothetical protein